MFLAKTVENILSNIEGNTDVIAVLDGAWADPEVPDDPRVTVIHYAKSIGQRAATNRAVMLSKAKYIMKCDAHCAFDKGFDVKMMREMHDDWTMVPLMKNLHAFDWVCKKGHRRYQGPSGPCTECGAPTTRDVMWEAKPSPNSVSYCFDSVPHFQYFGDWPKRPQGKGEIAETMSLQGSCFMLTRDKYWELSICDENFGSWGSQGIEVAVKTWLSGGAVMVNKKTWYAHMFRTQGGDFGFPYPISGSDQEKAKKFARDLFFNNNWPLQKKPLSWLVEKFWPVPGWTDEDLKKLKENKFEFSEKSAGPGETEPAESLPRSEAARGEPAPPPTRIIYTASTAGLTRKKHSKEILFYTDHALNLKTAFAIQKNIRKISGEKNIPIVSVSIKPMGHMGRNITIPGLKIDKNSDKTLILTGLEAMDAEIIYVCKKDVVYPSSFFDFEPADENTVHTINNGFCGYKKALISFFKNEKEH